MAKAKPITEPENPEDPVKTPEEKEHEAPAKPSDDKPGEPAPVPARRSTGRNAYKPNCPLVHKPNDSKGGVSEPSQGGPHGDGIANAPASGEHGHT